MVIKVGWLQQNMNNLFGGAEFSANALLAFAPKWAEVVYCPPNKRPPADIDLFVIQNDSVYGRRWIEELARKPVIKQVRDPWYAGDCVYKRWLLDNADLLIFSSPVQLENFGYEFDRPHKIMPVPVDLQPFKEAAAPADKRFGTVFVGRTDIFKGMPAVLDWALRTGEPLVVIGNPDYANNMGFGEYPNNITFAGEIPYEKMPQYLGTAKNYIAMPEWPEAFGRSVVEAWAAGCNLILKNRIGAQYWIENEPERLGFMGPINEFWDAVKEVAQ